MGAFARWRPGAGVRPTGTDVTDTVRALVAPGFEAVAEALISGSSPVDACWRAGHAQAAMGSSLGEILEGLRAASRHVAGRDPSFEESQALSQGWSEFTLSYLHGLSCLDPLTGLATQAHLRERLGALYRASRLTCRDVSAAGERKTSGHALVIADLGDLLDPLSTARRIALLGQTAGSVFPAAEPIARVGLGKVAVLAERDDRLARRTALLRRMSAGQARRVWIETLPSTETAAVHLLDELARA